MKINLWLKKPKDRQHWSQNNQLLPISTFPIFCRTVSNFIDLLLAQTNLLLIPFQDTLQCSRAAISQSKPNKLKGNFQQKRHKTKKIIAVWCFEHKDGKQMPKTIIFASSCKFGCFLTNCLELYCELTFCSIRPSVLRFIHIL